MEFNPKRICLSRYCNHKPYRRNRNRYMLQSTDPKQSLLFTSCHPKHVKLIIPFSLAKGTCIIVSEPSKREQKLEELKDKHPKNKQGKTNINELTKAKKNLKNNENMCSHPRNSMYLIYKCKKWENS